MVRAANQARFDLFGVDDRSAATVPDRPK